VAGGFREASDHGIAGDSYYNEGEGLKCENQKSGENQNVHGPRKSEAGMLPLAQPILE
jgi:hypothetical protein